MLKLLKRRLALLLAAALIMTSGTFAFAAESTGDEAVISDSAVVAEDSTATVSDPSKDPTTWSKDPYSVAHTYLLYLTGITDLEDADMVSSDKIVNGKKVDKAAVSGGDLEYLADSIQNEISYNCIHVEGDYYVVYAYGISGGEFGREYGSDSNYNKYVASTNGALAASVNSWGMDVDGKPAGIFDYNKFTWSEKGGSATGNGKIIYDAAVVKWSSGQKAEKLRLFTVDNLYYKNNMYATVSYCATKDGKWQKLNSNAFQKPSKQPSFYPKMKLKKSYRDVDGTKIKPTSEIKKLKSKVNRALKSNKIEFEIRRRPIAGTVSEDYIGEDNRAVNTTFKYVTIMGDDLDFKNSGKLKKATVQFKSIAYTKEKDADSDKAEKSTESSGNPKAAKVQATGYYITHALKMQKLKDADVTDSLESSLLKGEFKKKTKKDLWYTTKTIDGYDTLIVYGAHNLEGVAAFRKRKDKSVGEGYYNSDKDCFITTVD